MNIQTIIKILTDSGIEENEAKIEVNMLLEHFCSYTANDKLRGILPDENQLKIIEKKVQIRAKERIPIQYIIGESLFMGNFFKVTPDVLIPRDETEILVRKAIEIINDNNFKTVLDIGTGSGCIACIIAKQTDSTVLGIDISSDALRVALDNVTRLNINNKAVFRKSNLYEKIRPEEKFDLIISNPPYIPSGTILQEEVQKEPSIALYAENNGLEFYEKIIKNAPKYLNPNGYLMFELGIGEAEAVKSLLEKDFENIVILNDLSGIERVIYGKVKDVLF